MANSPFAGALLPDKEQGNGEPFVYFLFYIRNFNCDCDCDCFAPTESLRRSDTRSSNCDPHSTLRKRLLYYPALDRPCETSSQDAQNMASPKGKGKAPAAASSSSATPSIPLPTRLQRKLAPFRKAALGIAEGIQSTAESAITDIVRQDPAYDHLLPKSTYYKYVEDDVTFYEVTREPRASGATDCKGSVEASLWRGAIMHTNCQKAVYCLLEKVREVLSGKLSPVRILSLARSTER